LFPVNNAFGRWFFVAGGYVKTDTETSGGGGHVGVYKSARAQRKYNAFLFAIPPIGARAEFDFETTTFVVSVIIFYIFPILLSYLTSLTYIQTDWGFFSLF